MLRFVVISKIPLSTVSLCSICKIKYTFIYYSNVLKSFLKYFPFILNHPIFIYQYNSIERINLFLLEIYILNIILIYILNIN